MKYFFTFQLFFLAIASLSAQTEEEPKGKISSVFFMDYYYNAARDTGFANIPNTAITGDKGVHGLRIRRIFFTYDYKFNSKLSSRFRLESDELNFTTNSAGNKANKFGVIVKDAFIKWNYIGWHSLIVGIQNTPAYEVSESLWGNRYIEKTIMDLRGAVSSRDLGLSLRGQFDSTGIFKYWLMYTNGDAGLPEKDKYKRYYAQFELTLFKNLSITVYGDYQAKVLVADDVNPGRVMNGDILTSAFFIGYKVKDKFTAGVETYFRKVKNAYKLVDSYDNLNGMGLSIFGNYFFNQKIGLFARFDRFDPNLASDAKGDSRNLYIGGLAFKPAEKFIISPNIFIETFEKVGALKIKNSVTPRVTLSWTF
jgi:hypothetical protein